MANNTAVVSRPVPADIPGWVVWALALGQTGTNKRVVWIGIFAAAVCITSAWFTRPVSGRYHLTVSGSWAITAAMVIIVLAAIGLQRNFRIGGVLISERNLMSLTRFQIVAWTVMIGSALLAVVLARAVNDDVNPVEAADLKIPSEVWELVGISGGSAVLSTFIKKNKQQKAPANVNAVADRMGQLTDASPEVVKKNLQGILYGNASGQEARFMDMLEGDELGNAAFVDVGKLQMFLFTCVALLMYGQTLWVMFRGAPAMINEFPGLTEAMVTIIGFSHAAYLGMKTVDQTATDPKAAPPEQTSVSQPESENEDNGENDA